MMRLHRFYLTGTVLIISFIILGGCLGKGTQKATKLYLLEPLSSSMEEQGAPADEGIVLGVGPIKGRDYLNRPQIVTRTSKNEITIHEFHHWGESLGDNFTVVLAQNLSILLSTDQMFIYPWSRKPPLDFQVVVDIVRFDGEFGVEASLLAHYYVLKFDEEGTREQMVMRKSSFSKPIKDDSYEALVSAMSELVADFSREVADEIRGACE
ncbi:MAG: PqiC family protein [Syntrophobacteria bacterium]